MDLQFKQAAAEEKRLPGTSGIWTFLFMDMIVFFAIFAVFASERSRIPAVYLSSQQQLNGWLGLANTIVLLTSSWFMVRAVQAARMNDCRAVRINMNGAIAAAFIFITSKSYEYYSKFLDGIGFATNSFYSFYYFMTIVHLLHVIIGLIFINSIKIDIVKSRNVPNLSSVENIALFWHLVDILWIYILTIVYLLGVRG